MDGVTFFAGETRVTTTYGAATDFDCSLPLGLSVVQAGFPSPAEEYTTRWDQLMSVRAK